jgi:tRNA (mo5U34)-methyltransferase
LNTIDAERQSEATLRAIQKEIDAITWYHEFDFGDGLHAITQSQADDHRKVWRFIESALDKIEFSGRSVLDIGCWDGYWSFYAERRGARRVLATDDVSQNWAEGTGLRLAKRLLKSSVEINQNVSIYECSKLGQTFDIVLCLGVYYHLVDPFAGFAELRHLLHKDSIVIFVGDGTLALRPNLFLWDPSDPAKSAFVPTPWGLKQMLLGAYMNVVEQQWMQPPPSFVFDFDPMRLFSAPGLQDPDSLEPLKHRDHLLTIARPFEGENPVHPYKPPFNLAKFDPRYR